MFYKRKPVTSLPAGNPCLISDPKRLAALRAFQILDTEFESAFDEIVKIAALACNAPIAVINFIDETRQWFKAEVGLGIRETALDISICRHAILEHDLMVINDTLKDSRTCQNPLALASENPLRFYAGALLKEGELPLGTLCVLDYSPRELTPAQLQILQGLRNQVMRLLDYRRLNLGQQRLLHELDQARSTMQQMAQTDTLTGLLNRRAFEAQLITAMKQRQLPSGVATLMVLDLDRFKQVNDTHGHQVGDQVLSELANILRQTLRSHDLLCRWGGEEFLALLPGLSPQQAGKVAQRIHQALADHPVRIGSLTIPLSASIGLAQAQEGDEPDAIIKRADDAMYQAKSSGPGRTVTHT